MKECGSCGFWFKFKSHKFNGRGLCQKIDCSGKAEHGRNCPHWKGKKYKRKVLKYRR